MKRISIQDQVKLLAADKAGDEDAVVLPPKANGKPAGKPKVSRDIERTSATEYETMEVEEPVWIIPGMLCEGLTIFSGALKLGKSWMALDLCLGVGSGNDVFGGVETVEHHAGYFALEDGKRRIKSRLAILKQRHDPLPADVWVAHELFRLDQGGLEQLKKAFEDDPLLKLVVIDVWQKVRPPKRPGQSEYEGDYSSLSAVKKIADEHHAAIVLIHHIRKMESNDPHERVNGSVGIGGCADASWVLFRGRGEGSGELHITGRDVEEQSIALSFEGGLWTSQGDLKTQRQTNTKIAILNVLREWGPRKPAEIADLCEMTRGRVKMALGRMEKACEVAKVKSDTGHYTGEYEAVTTVTKE